VPGSAFIAAWDEDVAIALAGSLSDAGWLVAIEHLDALVAWRRISQATPDVVVVDLRIRPGHGHELLRMLAARKTTRHLPVVRLEDDADVVAAASDAVKPTGHS
jgi:DNA-binding NarL/FixJ family response regulator